MAFHPDTTGWLAFYAPSVNPTHRETPGDVPASTQRRQHQEFQLWTAPCSPGIILCLCPASYLIPGTKTRKTSRAGSRPLSCRRRCFLPPGTALPCSRTVSRRSKQPSTIRREAEHPKIHPDPTTDGPSGTTHNPSPTISTARGFTPIWMSSSHSHQSKSGTAVPQFPLAE